MCREGSSNIERCACVPYVSEAEHVTLFYGTAIKILKLKTSWVVVFDEEGIIKIGLKLT